MTTSLVRSSLIIVGSILLVSMLATLTIFPLVFHYGMNPAAGTELVFDVLATVFAQMPGGRVFGTVFFFLLVLAARGRAGWHLASAAVYGWRGCS